MSQNVNFARTCQTLVDRLKLCSRKGRLESWAESRNSERQRPGGEQDGGFTP